MHKISSFGVTVALGLLLAPALGQAQAKENADDFGNDVLNAVFGSHWNVFLHAGTNSHGRFLLQRVPIGDGATGERKVRTHGGYTVGGGAGVDILQRTSLRFEYVYGNSDLAFRTDIGNGSEILDVDDLGQMATHSISVEILRYMLPSRAAFTPYGTIGLVGVWWQLNDVEDEIDARDNSEFRVGAQASFGLKVKATSHFDVRLEAASSSVRNPFTGRESYRVLSGLTMEEPTRVSKSAIRFAAIYNFSKPEKQQPLPRRTARRPPSRR
ncbi:MAG TPA: outer membrane beta-barrel protein [Longimicrobiales bacterium]